MIVQGPGHQRTKRVPLQDETPAASLARAGGRAGACGRCHHSVLPHCSVYIGPGIHASCSWFRDSCWPVGYIRLPFYSVLPPPSAPTRSGRPLLLHLCKLAVHPRQVPAQPVLQNGHLCSGRQMYLSSAALKLAVCTQSAALQRRLALPWRVALALAAVSGPLTAGPLLLRVGVPGLEQYRLVEVKVAQHSRLDLHSDRQAGRQAGH